MKNVVVIVAGSGQHHDLSIEAGTTARDILQQIGLQGFVLTKDGDHKSFGEDESVYEAITDGQKLYAASITDVGRKAA